MAKAKFQGLGPSNNMNGTTPTLSSSGLWDITNCSRCIVDISILSGMECSLAFSSETACGLKNNLKNNFSLYTKPSFITLPETNYFQVFSIRFNFLIFYIISGK